VVLEYEAMSVILIRKGWERCGGEMSEGYEVKTQQGWVGGEEVGGRALLVRWICALEWNS
jgi:hypothetical protein